MPEIEPITPLNNDMDITQPGAFIVKVIPHDIPYMLRARTDTHQVDVTLAGIYSADLGNPLCNDIVKERLRLLTSNPAATFTMNVISSDPNNPGAVIAQVTRHDNVDIGLDLVASGYAVLKDQPFEGFEMYQALRNVARANLYGMWNEGECQFSPFYLEGQSAKQTTTAAR